MDPSARTGFAEAIAGHEHGLAYDFTPASRTLLITFGGLARAPGLGPVPPFEFVNASASFPVKKLFLRDHQRAWYHRGVVGAGSDLESVADRLRELIAASEAERTVALGNSSGGYAALAFGDLLALTEVHAFSPQTFIEPRLRQELGDARWDDSVQSLMRSGGFDERFGDLRERVVNGTAETAFHVYHSANRIDVVHAQRVADAPRVTLHSYDIPGHWLVGRLRGDGSLHALLERSLAQGG
jgi:hypothetical protein